MVSQNIDYTSDGDAKKTVQQVAGTTAAAAATTALVAVEAPVIIAGTLAIGAGVVAAKTVGAVWDWLTD